MTRLRGLAALIAALALLASTAGCGGSDEKDANDTAADNESSAESSPSASRTLSQDEIQARIISNAPPADLVWLVPEAPKGWKVLPSETGALQYHVGQEPCTVILDQPNGVGEAEEPTSIQVVEREVTRIGDSLQATDNPKWIVKDEVMVANKVTGLDGSAKTKFAHGRVSYNDATQADVRALRNGDFALIAAVACGQGRFDAVFDAQVAPFLAGLAAHTTY